MEANLKNEKFFLSLIEKDKLKVTKSGRAYNLITGNEIGKKTGKNIYRKLSWLCKKRNRIIQLHRIVWARYKGIPEDPKLVINHKDGNKQKCNLGNLELITSSQNNKHAVRTGLASSSCGELNGFSKLQDAEVVKSRRLFRQNKSSCHELAKKYGVHHRTMQDALRGKTFKHLPP